MSPPDEYDFDEIKDVCAMCNHNRSFHIYVKEMQTVFCKVQRCGCHRSVRDMMRYAQDLLELWR